MKSSFHTRILLPVFVFTTVSQVGFAQICTNPANVIYGLTNTGGIHPITVSTGAVAPRLNPLNTGLAPSLSNAMGYNPLNGKFYYFKRHAIPGPQVFQVWDPAMGSVTVLPNSPSASVSNLGCITQDGSGYYCIDATGSLFYYSIPLNVWRTIGSNIIDQFGNTLASIISTNSRIAGDIAIDGRGNMWIIVAGNTDFGLYRLPAPLPVAATPTVNITQLQAPTTPTPTGNSFGGIAFNSTGQIFLSTNNDNKLYRLENNLSITFLSNMTLSGIGNDLTSCNFPLMILPAEWNRWNAVLSTGNNVSLQWSITDETNTRGYRIEYSSDGSNWNELAFINATGAGSGNEYYYLHETSFSTKQFYRIGRVTTNEGTYYSKVKVVSRGGSLNLKLWPNPATELLQVELEGGRKNNLHTLVLSDQIGREVKRFVLADGETQISLRMLPPGVYVASITSTDGQKFIKRFVKN